MLPSVILHKGLGVCYDPGPGGAKMKVLFIVVVGLIVVLAACGGGKAPESDGWGKVDRESLTQDCIAYTIAEGDLSDSYASRYCRCWVQGMEAHYTAEYADTIINGGELPDPEVLSIGIKCLSE
jgi:hypothetical protein